MVGVRIAALEVRLDRPGELTVWILARPFCVRTLVHVFIHESHTALNLGFGLLALGVFWIVHCLCVQAWEDQRRGFWKLELIPFPRRHAHGMFGLVHCTYRAGVHHLVVQRGREVHIGCVAGIVGVPCHDETEQLARLEKLLVHEIEVFIHSATRQYWPSIATRENNLLCATMSLQRRLRYLVNDSGYDDSCYRGQGLRRKTGQVDRVDLWVWQADHVEIVNQLEERRFVNSRPIQQWSVGSDETSRSTSWSALRDDHRQYEEVVLIRRLLSDRSRMTNDERIDNFDWVLDALTFFVIVVWQFSFSCTFLAILLSFFQLPDNFVSLLGLVIVQFRMVCNAFCKSSGTAISSTSFAPDFFSLRC